MKKFWIEDEFNDYEIAIWTSLDNGPAQLLATIDIESLAVTIYQWDDDGLKWGE